MNTPVPGTTLPLDTIHPIRQVKLTDFPWSKYATILASVREIGLIEPLVVCPKPIPPAPTTLLDGHLRLEAFLQLGRTAAVCLLVNREGGA